MAFGGLAIQTQLAAEVFGPPAIKFTNLGLFPRGLNGCIPTDWPQEYVSGESPIIYANVFESRQHPDIWMSLTDVMAMYWRVKKWKWSVSMNWAEIDNTVASYSFNEVREVWAGGLSFLEKENSVIVTDIQSEEPTTDERSLVCGFPTPEAAQLVSFDGAPPIEVISYSSAHFAARIGEIWTASGGEDQGVTSDVGRAYIRWGGEMTDVSGLTSLPYPPAYARKNQQDKWEYMPTIGVTLDAGAASRWQIRVFPDLEGQEESYGTMTYKFLDKTYECPIYATNSSSGDPDFTNTLQINATLEAIDYWPYDPGDGGGGIYSATTGDKLR